jgi:phosphatidylserine/phosphatidylglycerophosphate/cardiolipin synthase-like enzyme
MLATAAPAGVPARQVASSPSEFFKGPSLSALESDGPWAGAAFSVPPVGEWAWYEGPTACSLSPVAESVDRVVRAISRRNPAAARVPEALVTTRRNAVGPALMDSAAIFKAASRLIEIADREIDLMTFATEPDSDPYLDLVRGFERRLASGRPLARPFRIRLYTDHLSVLMMNGRARHKARTLLDPWMELFKRHGLDPQAVQIEAYVNAHGAFLYHRGGRYSVHDKLLVVDGAYLHIGGANPQSKNNYAHPERDTALVVKGDVGASALAAFDSLWSRTDFSCRIERAGGTYTSACADRRTPFTVVHDPVVTSRAAERAGVSSAACVPMMLLSKDRAGFENLGGYSNAWAKGLLAAVSASARTIALSSPNMNAPPLEGALVEAMGQRNVRVALLLPAERNEPQVNALGGYGSNENAMRVINACTVVARARSGPESQRLVTNFEPRWWVAEGDRAPFAGDGPGCFHAKFASFDGRTVIVGSGNLDDQSFFHSTETSLLIDDAVVTRRLSAVLFEPEWLRAQPVRLRPLLTPSGTDTGVFDRLTSDARGLCSGLAYSLR